MTLAAYAKVNLTLEILGMRPDGYHDLRSVVAPVSLADVVTLEPSDEVALDVRASHPFLSAGLDGLAAGDNLAVRAVRLLQRVGGVRSGAAITLEKRIPAGGGLGGGSADAAAVLNGLNDMWHLGIPRQDLAALGSEIGSDVPALVLGGPVLMEGRGERVSSLHDAYDGGCFHMVLANPHVFCSTAKIFSQCKVPLQNRPEILYNMRQAMRSGSGAAVARALQNDLAAAAMRLHPELEETWRRLEAAGCLGVSMSGSGATVFGLVGDAVEAGRVAHELVKDGLWAVPVETVR